MNESMLSGLVGQVFSNPIVVSAGVVLAASLVALWVLAVAWAFHDLAHRSERLWPRYAAAAWVLLSGPILLPLSVGVVTLVRPQQPAGERRLSDLLEMIRARAAMRPSCGACGDSVDPAWVRCPTCASWLAQQCPRCEGMTPTDVDICPWCAWSPEEVAVEAPRVAVRPEVGIPVRRREPVVFPEPLVSPAPATIAMHVQAGIGAVVDAIGSALRPSPTPQTPGPTLEPGSAAPTLAPARSTLPPAQPTRPPAVPAMAALPGFSPMPGPASAFATAGLAGPDGIPLVNVPVATATSTFASARAGARHATRGSRRAARHAASLGDSAETMAPEVAQA